MNYKTYKGRYTPENPDKYMGNPNNIIYRSGWELQVFRRLDLDPSVLKWASEEFSIVYFNPIDQKSHRYFPDIYLENKAGDKIVMEIKPDKYTKPPVKPKRQTKRYLEEASTYMINQAKWNACKKFCDERGWIFVISTEKNSGFIN